MPVRKKSRTKLVPFSARRRKNARWRATAPEKSIHSTLDALRIEYIREKEISRCHVDVFVEPATVIEVLGCYWHKHDCQEPDGGWCDVDQVVKDKDEARFAFLRGRGYTVIPVWECEINEHPERVMAKLKKLRR